ncbi:MAG: MinD/ParA family protein [Wenzhouxiangellaceae bacterium]|nr:MinD/ParA family protein [Wenzhouxiangellaceae bacterium]
MAETTTNAGVRVIAVASGKGGVGKTNVSVNLACALAAKRRRVWLLDADFGLANVDVLLGLRVRNTLADVVDGRCALADIVIDGPAGLKIVPAASGVERMANLSLVEARGLIEAFSVLADELDVLVVDVAAGISHSVMMFAGAAHEVLVVVCDEPASMTDAYALIKVLHQDYGVAQVRILANMVRSEAEGRALYRKLARVTDQYLDVVVRYAGYVPFDDQLRRALRLRQPVLLANPGARASHAFKKLADTVDTWDRPDAASGNISFFLESALARPAGASGAP